MTATNNPYGQIAPLEEREIDSRVEFEIVKSHFNMLKLGAAANVLSGLFVIWSVYTYVPLTTLAVWYVCLVITSVLDILWALPFEGPDITFKQLQTWRKGFYYIVGAICLTWGSMDILFGLANNHYEIYVITFLQVVVLAFAFTSITDFIISTISIVCLLLPTIIYRFYLFLNHAVLNNYDNSLNLAIAISLLILGTFILIAAFFGANIAKKLIRLSYTNVVLSKKLEGMNKLLEQRVKERTLELEKSLKLVTYQATHDLLTDLPNQRLLIKYVRQAIKRSQENNYSFAVIFFSLNEIERINNGLGYIAGDYAIKIIADRLKEKFSNQIVTHDQMHYTLTLSRKDVFVLLLQPIIDSADIEDKANILFSVLGQPVTIENQPIKLTASIGVSLYPRDGKTIKRILMNTDATMLYARQRGGNSLSVYKPEINADISRQLEIASNLHTAIERGEFILRYQPFYDLHSDKMCGVEALLSWKHPELGLVSPVVFIPLAEANGTIIALGEWALRTACYQAKAWQDMGYPLKVAVNLSAKQLENDGIVKTVATILKETQLDPACLDLELTESEVFQVETIPILKKFKSMGLSLSIDDFGTGYSGLSNLKLFSIDKLKIDKSFVQDIVSNKESQDIVANTIGLAKKFNVLVLAEGVETKEQAQFLKQYQCDMIQGYYFSPAVPADEITQLLKVPKKIVL